MKEDYIELPFSLEKPINFGIGCYVEIDGMRYEVTDIQSPKLNNSTHGYDYQLRLDAYYWKWKNKIFKFTPEVGGQEASWSLTASLDVHLSIFLKNLKALGYNYRGIEFAFAIDNMVENKAISMTYENTNMIDALSIMAESWDYEWWVTDNVIHFGRCEYGDGLTFKINENVAEMTSSASQSSYATRLYVFGSTRNLPVDYRPMGEDLLVNGVVQKRLMLPEGIPCIDAYEGMSEEEAVEEVVIIDNVYPKFDGVVFDVKTYEVSVENKDGSTSKETFYRFKDESFYFSEDYVLEGTELKVKFTSGLLNGMEFEVKFNPLGEPEKDSYGEWNSAAQLFEIVANEDYGRKLPDSVLCPKTLDTYVLIGWDSTKIADLGLVSKAEEQLYQEGLKISAKRKIDPNTYNCKMFSDYMFGLDSNGNQNSSYAKKFKEGCRVRLINDAFFKDGRESRIIGYEYSLDRPYDSPVYTVGEAAPYSRLGALENELKALTFKGKDFASGGSVNNGGFYVITSNDTTAPTDNNVYSALRSDKTYLRKDKSDETAYTLGVGGLKFQQKPINRFIRFFDEDKPEVVTDADMYSALMVDERIKEGSKEQGEKFLRKDKEDIAHKHITFEEGITVHGMAKMENIEISKLASFAQLVVQKIGSASFVDGFLGVGWQIWKAIATGDWNFTIDRLTVRKIMTVYELVIQKIRAVGGMVVVSAGNGKVKSVEQVDLEYKIEFEDTNTFVENDLIRCQTWSGNGIKYYWVEVVRVEDQCIYTRMADHAGVPPEEGDEIVLMGNTKDKTRQGLVLISAAEDGQPRVDVLDGVRSTNFDDCLKSRMGSLDGINDERFPSDMQPHGYGLYANNCFLTGVFVLSNGNDVMTQFSIMEGMIRTSISSLQQQINTEDNFLANASMTASLESWECNNDVDVFRTYGGLLHFNGNFYSIKNAVAGIVPNGDRNVLRLKSSWIRQRNADFAKHPEFDLVEQMTTDEEGNEVSTGIALYRPRMFYISFRCLVNQRGTLRVYFQNEQSRSDFEPYTRINETEILEAGNYFRTIEIAGKWNGTGDFYLSFDGDMFLYDINLAENALADMEERWKMQLEITDKKIQANAENIKQQGEDLEAYYAEFLLTAEEFTTRFQAIEDKAEQDKLELEGKITNTAAGLQADYTKKITDSETNVTNRYTSAIKVSAEEVTAKLTADLTDLERGLKEDYSSKITASATSLQSDYNAKIVDLKTGEIKELQSSITQQADLIATKVSQTEFDMVEGWVLSNYTEINQTKKDITALAGKIETDANGNITNISKSGLVLDSEFASLFSSQVTSQGLAKSAELKAYVKEDELEGLVSKIEISADQIDLTGKVTLKSLASDVANTLDDKASVTYVDELEDSLGSLAWRNAVGKAQLDSTVIEGGYIKTTLINASALTISGSQVSGLGLIAYKDSINSSDVSGLGALATKDSVSYKDVGLKDWVASASVKAALEGETVIVGGYISTDLINVNTLVAKKLATSADSEGFTINISDGTLTMKNDQFTAVYLNADGSIPALFIKNKSGQSTGMNPTAVYGPKSTLDTEGLQLGGGSIGRFTIRNVDSSVYGSSDFVVLTSNSSLPSASTYKGKVIFVRFSGKRTLSGAIMPRNSGTAVTSVQHEDKSAFYVSDGSNWYEFFCYYS